MDQTIWSNRGPVIRSLLILHAKVSGGAGSRTFRLTKAPRGLARLSLSSIRSRRSESELVGSRLNKLGNEWATRDTPPARQALALGSSDSPPSVRGWRPALNESETTRDAPHLDVRRVVRQIIHADQLLPDQLRREITALGSAAVSPLLEVLQDEALAQLGSPGDGWAPVHAARLLGGLRAAEAVEPMLRVLADSDWGDVLHDQVIQSLPSIGLSLVEPALQAYVADDGDDFRQGVCAVLADAGVKDDRILEILVEQLRRDPGCAGNLAIYGDERAVPHLLDALDRYEIVETENPLANHALIELRAAIEDLGGTLTAEQQLKCRRGCESAESFRRKMDSLLAPRRVDVVPVREPARRRDRPGRNEPCWCGSARKYKKCHLQRDESDAFAR